MGWLTLHVKCVKQEDFEVGGSKVSQNAIHGCALLCTSVVSFYHAHAHTHACTHARTHACTRKRTHAQTQHAQTLYRCTAVCVIVSLGVDADDDDPLPSCLVS